MRLGISRALVLGLVLATPPPAAGQSLEIGLSWPDGLAVSCGIPAGASRLVLIGGVAAGGSIGLAAGLDGPFVRAGPLVPAGLLRVAAGPLGFGPGTDVGDEATGMRPGWPRATAAARAVQVTVVPDLLAVFLREPVGDGGALGGAIGPVRRGAVRLDAAAVLSEFGASAPGSTWYREAAPYPRGRVLSYCGRIRLDLAVLSLSVAGGASVAECALPGWFALGLATVGRGGSGIDLLAAAASPDYLELDGGDDPGGARAGVRLRLACPTVHVVARYVLAVDAPGFVPGPWLHSVADLGASMERSWPATTGCWEAALAGSNRIETASDGTARDDPSGSLSAGWRGDRLRVGLAVMVERDGGLAVEACFDAADREGRTDADLALRCAFVGGAPCLRADAGMRLAWGDWDVSAEAGTGDVTLARGGLRSARPRISLSLGVNAPEEADAPAR